jgi:hypothetical protein
MNLQQSGDEIDGWACALDGSRLMFRTPVRGEHPNLRWVATPESMIPPYAYFEGAPRNVFIGEIDDTGDIIGSGAGWRDMRFTRADPARNVRCR